jgi:hypothetical protein
VFGSSDDTARPGSQGHRFSLNDRGPVVTQCDHGLPSSGLRCCIPSRARVVVAGEALELGSNQETFQSYLKNALWVSSNQAQLSSRESKIEQYTNIWGLSIHIRLGGYRVFGRSLERARAPGPLRLGSI